MNPQNNQFYKLNMLALGIEKPTPGISKARKDSYKRMNGKVVVDEKQQNLKKHQTDRLIHDIKSIIERGVIKNKMIYQELEDNFLMPLIAGEPPSDEALRIYVRRAKQLIAEERNGFPSKTIDNSSNYRYGLRMTEEQRSKLIDDFKNVINKHGNLSNLELIKLLDKSKKIPILGGFKVSIRVLSDYISLARVDLRLPSKSPIHRNGKSKKHSDEIVKKISDMYSVKKMSIVEIANEMAWSWSKTREVLMLYGTKMRSRSEAITIAGHRISQGKHTTVGAK